MFDYYHSVCIFLEQLGIVKQYVNQFVGVRNTGENPDLGGGRKAGFVGASLSQQSSEEPANKSFQPQRNVTLGARR